MTKTSNQEEGRRQVVIYYLKLRHNAIDRLPAHFLEGLHVIHLIATGANLSQVDQLAFTSSNGRPAVAESLDLSQNHLYAVPTSAMRPLGSLVTLHINYNLIEDLPRQAFAGLVSLLSLSLYGNLIREIHEDAFDGLGDNLTQLNLGKNQIGSIPTRAFSRLAALQKLLLNDNRIKQLIPWAWDMQRRAGFVPVAMTTTADPQDEPSGTYPAERIRDIPFRSLDGLDLARNQIRHIPAHAFSALPALNSLDLQGNVLESIHENAFYGLESKS